VCCAAYPTLYKATEQHEGGRDRVSLHTPTFLNHCEISIRSVMLTAKTLSAYHRIEKTTTLARKLIVVSLSC